MPTIPDRERFEGCLLGLALGDASGAPHEGGAVERLLWRVIGRTLRGARRWTDDTQMSIDVVAGLIEHGRVDPDDLARRFAASYRWSRGYGPGAAKVLGRIGRGQGWAEARTAVYPEGSWGNGGAMRAPVLGLVYGPDDPNLAAAARASAGVTHAHPHALAAAALVARACALFARDVDPPTALERLGEGVAVPELHSRLALARSWLGTQPDHREVRARLGTGMAATESVVTAIWLACVWCERPFLPMVDHAAALGGDVDTIAAMAGALWGARRGAKALPKAGLDRLEDVERLRALARDLHARFS